MANRDFLRYRFGTVKNAFVSFKNQPFDISSSFAKVLFEREEYLSLSGKDPIPIKFHDKRQMLALRSRCNMMEHEGLPVVIAKSAADINDIELEFMFPTQFTELDGNIPILFDSEVVKKIRGIDDKEARKQLLRDICLTLPFANKENNQTRFLIRRAPAFFDTEGAMCGNFDEEAQIVKFFLPSGILLSCRLKKNQKGYYYLHATSTEEADLERNHILSRVYFISLGPNASLREIDDESSISENNLNHLIVKSSPLIDAWANYHKILKSERDRIYKQRHTYILTYSNLRPSQDQDNKSFEVDVDNWNNEIAENWCDNDESLPKYRDIKIDAEIDIKGQNADPMKGKLTKICIRQKAVATIKIDSKIKHTPNKNGEIQAVDRGDSQNKRRKQAMSALQKGNVALPILLDILNEPENAPRAQRRNLKNFRHRFNDSQLDAIEYALGNALGNNKSIMVIQGPPGTGKTHVIAEIISRIFQESKQEQPKILISSTQNIAVKNIIDKLIAKGLLVHTIYSREAQEDAEEKGYIIDYSSESDKICKAIGKTLEKEDELKNEIKIINFINDFDHTLSLWPETQEDVLAYLEDLASGNSQLNEISDMILTDISKDAAEWHQLLSSALEPEETPTQDNNNQDSNLKLKLQKFRDSISIDFSTIDIDGLKSQYEDIERINPDLTELRSIRETIKKIRRGKERNTLPAINKFQTCIHAINNIIGQNQKVEPSKELGITSLLADIRTWVHTNRELLQNLTQQFNNKRAVILQRWQKSLKDTPSLWEDISKNYAQAVAATCQMSASDTLNKTEYIDEYDYVIIDEAARVELFDLLIPLIQGKSILLVCDQKQLPPMVEHAYLKNESTENQPIDLNILQECTLVGELYELLPEENRIFLNIQYRSHPDIGNAISKAFYDGQIYSGSKIVNSSEYNEWLETKKPYWGVCDNRPLVWIDSSSVSKGDCTYNNPGETGIAMECLQQLLDGEKESEIKKINKNQKIGIIAFYSAQVKSLHQEISSKFTKYSEVIQCGTVDAFQGMEFPVVILVCSRHNPKTGEVGFLSLPNRVNVALSRAQRQLIIIGSKTTLLHEDLEKGSPSLKAFVSAAGEDLYQKEGDWE